VLGPAFRPSRGSSPSTRRSLACSETGAPAWQLRSEHVKTRCRMPISQGSRGTAVLDLCLCDLDERSCPAPHGDRLRRSSMSNCPRHRTQRSTVVAGHPGHRQRAAAGLTHRGRPPPVTIGGFRGVCPHSSQLRRTQVSVLSAYGRRLTVRSNNRRLSRLSMTVESGADVTAWVLVMVATWTGLRRLAVPHRARLGNGR
jgi:hypothetical protein